MEPLTHVSVCAGIDAVGIAASHLGYRTTVVVENDEFCQRVLRKRLPEATIFGDLHDVTGEQVMQSVEGNSVDLMSAGFPCQGLSSAGKGLGLEDHRSALWFEVLRLVGEIRPRILLIENVAVLRTRGLDVVVSGLASIGYGCWWDCVPGLAVGAPHIRDRIWITAVAYETMPALDGTPGIPKDGKFPRAGASTARGLLTMKPQATQRMCKDALGAVRRDDGTTWLTSINSPLFPTPSAVSYGSNRGGAAGRVGAVRHGLESMARHDLFPTPTVGDSRNSRNSTAVRSEGSNGHSGTTLSDFTRLWPTATSHPRTHTPRPVHHGAQLANEVAKQNAVDEQSLWPTPRRSDGERGGRGDLIQVVRGNKNGSTHGEQTQSQSLVDGVGHDREPWPTPSTRDWKDSGENNTGEGRMGHGQLPEAVRNEEEQRCWPTPWASANELRTTKSAPSHGVSHGAVLSGVVCDTEREAGRTPPPGTQSAGPLNPAWVEWLLGIPIGWTDPACDEPAQLDWLSEYGIPRVLRDVPDRKHRLMALGNSLVWQVAYTRLVQAHDLLGIRPVLLDVTP